MRFADYELVEQDSLSQHAGAGADYLVDRSERRALDDGYQTGDPAATSEARAPRHDPRAAVREKRSRERPAGLHAVPEHYA